MAVRIEADEEALWRWSRGLADVAATVDALDPDALGRGISAALPGTDGAGAAFRASARLTGCLDALVAELRSLTQQARLAGSAYDGAERATAVSLVPGSGSS